MTVSLSFRIPDELVGPLDQLAHIRSVSRSILLRQMISEFLYPDRAINVARLNQTTEYSQAAMAALVDHLLPGQQNIIIATTAERLEVIHGQK